MHPQQFVDDPNLEGVLDTPDMCAAMNSAFGRPSWMWSKLPAEDVLLALNRSGQLCVLSLSVLGRISRTTSLFGLLFSAHSVHTQWVCHSHSSCRKCLIISMTYPVKTTFFFLVHVNAGLNYVTFPVYYAHFLNFVWQVGCCDTSGFSASTNRSSHFFTLKP